LQITSTALAGAVIVATTRDSRLTRPLLSGQITIPAGVRRKLGFTEDSMLEVSLDGNTLRITPVQGRSAAKDAAAMTDEKADQAIDAAIQASRRTHAVRP
jgi:AbrB family looped-hinge helix DNA binding protein